MRRAFGRHPIAGLVGELDGVEQGRETAVDADEAEQTARAGAVRKAGRGAGRSVGRLWQDGGAAERAG